MKKISLMLLALVAVIMAGCSDSPEVEAELKAMYQKVPGDAAVVVSGNLKKLVEQTGGKVKDGKIEWNSDIELPSMAGNNELAKKALQEMRDLSEGIDAGAFVCFVRKGQTYAIFKVRDPEVLKDGIDERFKGNWKTFDKIEYKGGYWLTDKGEYFWVADNVDLSEFEEWQQLSKVGSFLGNEYAPKMSASGDAINLWASLDAMYSTLSFSEQAQARMAVSMLFDQPAFITGHGNFDKRNFTFEAMPMANDYKPAKCVIDMSKIDPAVVESLGGNANMVFAVNISQKLIGQIKDLGKSMGGAVPQQIWSLISPLDGTAAVATGDLDRIDDADGAYKAVVTTNGQEDAALAQFLGSFGNVNIKGKTLTVSKGNYGNGELALAEVAKKMKDSWMAFAATSSKDDSDRAVYILLQPKEGTLALTLLSSF